MMDISAVNSLSCQDFVEVFGNVVEKCPLIAAAVWSQRPFVSVSAVEATVEEFIDCLPVAGKKGILRCHPELAGPNLIQGTLTHESQSEQNQAGLTALNPSQSQNLQQLNMQYQQRFGFPFVMCVSGHNKSRIEQQLGVRLSNDLDLELQISITEVKKICRLRLRNIIIAETRL